MNTHYNYQRFTPQEYHFEVFEGLTAEDNFKDAKVFTLEGEEVLLSEYLNDKPLVLETGSMTCPMYAQSVPPMRKFEQQFPELDFVLLYVREAHPGEKVPAHDTLQSKIGAAHLSRDHYQDNRVTLVDGIEGEAHKLYGAMPNSIYVIAPTGEILFHSIWNNANKIEGFLDKTVKGIRYQSEELKAVPPFSIQSIKTLLLGGYVALWDFVRGLPRLVANHKKVGNM